MECVHRTFLLAFYNLVFQKPKLEIPYHNTVQISMERNKINILLGAKMGHVAQHYITQI